jgi:hypothetical protein
MRPNSGHHYALNQHAGKLPVPTLMKSLRRMAPFIRPYRLIAFFLVITVDSARGHGVDGAQGIKLCHRRRYCSREYDRHRLGRRCPVSQYLLLFAIVTAIIMEISEEWQIGFMSIRLDEDF